MARNEEKAQSMLYRFREAQAAELGLAQKGDKRPRMASACKSLRDCERWRGEILREISRKVSKIQDAGLTDYEVRDLNDEINKLMREKRHWENQIVALGGANYRRNVAMLDEDGKEVPGTRGYKYFGRAKELPGVKELFQRNTEKEDEENKVYAYYKKYLDQGPAYFGDFDEDDEELLRYEKETEEKEWEDAYQRLRTSLNLSSDAPVPKIPRPNPVPLSKIMAQLPQPGEDATMTGAENGDTDSTNTTHPPMLSVLSPADLQHPKMPTKEEMEGVLLALRKRALMEQYLGDETPA
ncbi:NineTeen Complex (NTC) component [Ceratobasidium sp. 428]|nr:NineTeen Complex (NTC) component [Ceratobasidium sp. 395]KAG8768567.1 NineTeen Complex (NTC) component [Ceratobasidium sp. 428]